MCSESYFCLNSFPAPSRSVYAFSRPKMRVLITGTTGWLGGSLAAQLATEGHEVVGVSRRATDVPGVESVQLDISDAKAFSAYFAARPAFDCVLHLAGALGGCSVATAVDVNLGGTRVVVEAALDAGCRKIVVASSVAAVGTVAPGFPPAQLPFPADAPNVRGPWPYALSKSAVEDLCVVLSRLPAHRGADLLAVRVGNTVTDPPGIVHHDGAGIAWPVVPATSRTAASAEARRDGFAIFPEAALCSIALSDQLAGLRAAVLAPLKPGYRVVACVGPTAYSAEPVADVVRAWYPDAALDLRHFEAPGRERAAIYDLAPAKAELGWEPKIDLNAAIPLQREPVFLVIAKRVALERAEAWLAMARELAAATRAEAGCVFYEFVEVEPAASVGSSRDFYILEKWASATHLAAHAASAHFVRLVPALDAISETLRFDRALDALPSLAPAEAPVGEAAAAPVAFLVVAKRVAAEHAPAWLAMAAELATSARAAAGCAHAEVVEVCGGGGGEYVVVEAWETFSAKATHAASPLAARLVPAMDALCSTPRSDRAWNALGGAPLAAPPSGGTCGGRRGKVLVIYDSSTTCTAQMAALVADGARLLDRTDVRVRRIGGDVNGWDNSKARADETPEVEFGDVLWADGVAMGSPTNLGCVSWRVKKFWDDFSQAGHWATTDGRIGCAFSSVGGHAGGAELVCQAINNIMLNFGFSVFGVTDYVDFKNTLHYGAVVAKAPRDDVDQMACRRLGTRLAEFVGYYIVNRPETHPLRSSKARERAVWGGPIPPRSADRAELMRLNASPLELRDSRPTALVFTRMAAYAHESTPAAAHCVASLAERRGYRAVVTSQASALEGDSRFDVIVLINTSGDAFDLETETLSAHIARGGGVLGVHACVACFLDGADAVGGTPLGAKTPLIADVFGAHFVNHPLPQSANVTLDDAAFATAFGGALSDAPARALAAAGAPLGHTDEFFNYDRHPGLTTGDTVLVRVDEATYEGGTMGADHPVVWCAERGEARARVFYCGLGHFDGHYTEALVPALLETGFNFVAPDPATN